MLAAAEAYRSHADLWEDHATIRTRPRREIEDDDLRFYPLERQPLAAHPLIAAQGDQVVDFVLLQSLYKYINDVIIFETEIVNHTALNIAKRRFPFEFPFGCRHDAMSVVIDEDYHAYVAMDYMQQVISRTGIAPIELPEQIELSIAIPEAIAGLPAEYQAGMELIAVAIAENTVTAEVAAFSRDTSLKRSVKGLMADHLADEGRHSGFWSNLVRIYWASVSEEARLAIGEAVPRFLTRYLTNELQAGFDRRLIQSLKLSAETEAALLADLVNAYPITSSHPMINNIRNCLKRSGLLDHEPTRIHLAHFLNG